MKKTILLIFFFIILVKAQQWETYYNRIPSWPENLELANVESFAAGLENLKNEIIDAKPDYVKDMQNMTQAEAMKMAQEFQKRAMNMSPEEIKRRSQMAQSYTSAEMPKEIELDSKIEKVKQEFDDRIYNEIEKIRITYPCDIGLTSSDDKCEERSAALKTLGKKLADEYFLGSTSKFRGAVDEVNDYLIKVKLPVTVQREKDQYKDMGKNVTGASAAFELIISCIDQLAIAADRMRWISGMLEDENWHFSPGQY